MVQIDLSHEELEFLDDVLRYGEEDYDKRSHQYAKETGRNKDKRYQSYVKHKKLMFLRMRLKLREAAMINNKHKYPLNPNFNTKPFTHKYHLNKNKSPFQQWQDEKTEKERKEFKPKLSTKLLVPWTVTGNEVENDFGMYEHGVFYQDPQEEELSKIKIEKIRRVFNCGACGKQAMRTTNIRAYRPSGCKHPILKGIGDKDLICSKCKAWDYDVTVRGRKVRGNLHMKDGRTLKVSDIQKSPPVWQSGDFPIWSVR